MRSCYPIRRVRRATIYRLSVWRNGAGLEWCLYIPTGEPEHWSMSNRVGAGPFTTRSRR